MLNELRTTRIAIVGAGISGILTALELQKLGYEHVTLYEKADRITSVTTTIEHDKAFFDLSTKVIPAIGLSHNGVYPPLMELLESTGVTLDPFPIPAFYDFAKAKHMAVPAFMERFSKLKIIRDFAKAYDLLLEISTYASFKDVYATDLIRREESIMDWAKRHGIEAFGSFSDYLVDLFNMGPSHKLPAGVMLVSRIHSVAPYLHAVLSRKGIRHFYKLFGSRNKKAFRNFLDYAPLPTNYYVIKEGYEEFFRRLVKQHRLQVACNSTITGLCKVGDELRFTVNGTQTVVCDRIIFCCPPPAIAALSYRPEVKSLLAAVVPERRIRTWAFEVEQWDEQRFGRSGAVIDGTNRLGLATASLKYNGELNYILKERPDNDLIVGAVYLDNEMSDVDAEQALRTSLTHFNLRLKKVVAYQDFVWPHSFTLAQYQTGQDELFDALQGQDNLYYFSECFTGIGVPTILQFTKHLTNKHFNAERPVAPQYQHA